MESVTAQAEAQWLLELETPAVVVDKTRVLENINSMQKRADSAGVSLRPHIKTHKSVEIARLQLDAGATGITASKPDEAHVFIAAGIPSVTIAYPLVDEIKIARLLRAADYTGCSLRLIADSHPGVSAIASAARRMQTQAHVLLKIDVGLHRCGLDEHDPALLEMAGHIANDDHLHLVGILSHAGHSYAAPNRETIVSIAEEERRTMLRVRDQFKRAGIELAEISVGATPTVMAAESFDGITEIRPGNYIFMDRTQLTLGIAQPEHIALTVVATVVSHNRDYAIIDAGSKTLSSDRGPHGSDSLAGYGLALPLMRSSGNHNGWSIEKLSEEHGFMRLQGAAPDIGTRVQIIPNHSCVVANLADELVGVSPDSPPGIIRVDARGAVR